VLGLALSMALAVTGGCREEPSNQGTMGVEEEVRRMASDLSRDLGREGPSAWLRYFEPTEEFFMVSDGALKFDGYASAERYLGEFAPGVVGMELTWQDLRIDPLSPDLAVLAASYQELIDETSGSQLAFGGYVTALAVRTPEGWRLRHLHWSSEPPAAED